MANKMLIDATHPEETRVVVLRGNRVEEFDFETAHRRQLRGNIYLAKVTRVEPSLQAGDQPSEASYASATDHDAHSEPAAGEAANPPVPAEIGTPVEHPQPEFAPQAQIDPPAEAPHGDEPEHHAEASHDEAAHAEGGEHQDFHSSEAQSHDGDSHDAGGHDT